MKNDFVSFGIIIVISLIIGVLGGYALKSIPTKITYEVNFTDEEKELIFEMLSDIVSERM